MADEKAAVDVEYDDNGQPIVPAKAEDSEGVADAPKTEAEAEEDLDIDNPEIPVRNSVASHIIARKNKQLEKLRSQQEKDDEDGSKADDEDDLDPVMKKAVDRAVDKRMAPVEETLIGKADEEELQALFAQEPEAKGFEKRIRAYMKHPGYQSVPASTIYHDLAFAKAAAVGAKRKAVADKVADHTKSAGTSHRPTEANSSGIPTPEEMDDMDDAAFDELLNKARSGHFVR